MGFGPEEAVFLVGMARSGVSFSRVATIGRQACVLTESELQASFREFGGELTLSDASGLLHEQDGFAEPLFRRLGATEIVSIDASEYEGCSAVHDMNEPVPTEMHARFSVVIDGGSLEHVFGFPQAIENCMRLVAPSGHLLSISPANNEMGHGFYQFSPEIYFRLLSPENGFLVESMFLAETGWQTRWFQVSDPAVAGRRARVHNHGSTYLFVRARRISEIPTRLATPQQSDYESRWRQARSSAIRSPTPRRTNAGFMGRVPWRLRRRAHRAAMGLKSRYDPRSFRRIQPVDLARTEPAGTA